jgi:hypothetical protein
MLAITVIAPPSMSNTQYVDEQPAKINSGNVKNYGLIITGECHVR